MYKLSRVLCALALCFVLMFPAPLSALPILPNEKSDSSASGEGNSLTVKSAFMVQLDDGRFEKRYHSGDNALLEVLNLPDVVYVEPIYYLRKETSPTYQPTDVSQDNLWRFTTTQTSPLWLKSKAHNGALIGTADEILVAVIDDGVHAGIKDLNVGPGFDFADNDSDPTPVADHGNHVAGIIGATKENQLGTVGIYPNVRILPIKVFKNTGGGTTEYLAQAIDYAVAKQADVINLSLSYGGYSAVVKGAIDRALSADILVVAATGNDSKNWPLETGYRERITDIQLEQSMGYPALHAGVIAVGSAQYITEDLNIDGLPDNAVAISDFSNISGTQVVGGITTTRHVDLIAPGSKITSSYFSPSAPTTFTSVKSGTSMATPHVSGLLAQLKAQYPTLSAAQLIVAAKNTASTNVLTPTLAGLTPQNFIGAGFIQSEDALGYYLPRDITIEGQNGSSAEPLTFTFDPLLEEPIYTHRTTHAAIRMTILGSTLASSSVSGTPTVAGVSQWLDVSSLPVQFDVVTTATTGHQETYRIQVVAEAPTDARIKDLWFPASGKRLLKSQLGQVYRVPFGVEQIYMSASPEAENAAVTILGVAGKGRRVNLQVGLNQVPIVVTSENGIESSTEMLEIVRDSAPSLGDAMLHYFTGAGSATGTQAFSGTDLDRSQSEHRGFFLRPTAAASVRLSASQGSYLIPYEVFREASGAEYASLTPIFGDALSSSSTLNTLRGGLTFRYGYGNYRARTVLTLDSDAPIDLRLSQLAIDSGVLSPIFGVDTSAYSATVDHNTVGLTASAATLDPRAQVSIQDAVTFDGAAVSKALALQTGENAISIVVRKDSRYYVGDSASRVVLLNLARSPVPEVTTTVTTAATTAQPTALPQTTTAAPAPPPAAPSPPPPAAPSPSAPPNTTASQPPPAPPQPTTTAPVPPPRTDSAAFLAAPVVAPSGQTLDQLSVKTSALSALAARATGSQQVLVLNLDAHSPSSGSQGVQVLLNAETTALLKKEGKDLQIELSSGYVTLPNSLFASGETLKLTLSNSVSGPQNNASGILLNAPLQIELQQGGRNLTQFSNPLSIVLNFDPQSLASKGIVSSSQIAVFYWDKILGQWTYAGGRLIGEGQIAFKTKHLSTYSLRSYSSSFTDTKGHWAMSAIQWMSEKRIAQGVSDNAFKPNSPLTNAQFITYLSRALNLPHSATKAPYADAKSERWYSPFVNRSYAQGLLKTVYGNTATSSLDPDKPITREQMAGLLVNAYSYWTNIPKTQLLVKTELTYSDQMLVSSGFKSDVAIATQLKLMGGVTSNRFEPKRGATRAEAMAVLMRLINLLQ